MKIIMKRNSWIAPSFGDFGDDFDPVPSKKNIQSQRTTYPLKRQRDVNDETEAKSERKTVTEAKATQNLKRKGKEKETLDWVHKYVPTTKDDLAVHKKKILEVEGWLQMSLNKNKQGNKLLLLTGPAGAGKTACIKLLVEEMGLELHEWSNPATASYFPNDYQSGYSEGLGSRIGGPASESQVAQFRDFLLRANKYGALQLGLQETSGQKLILVEEFPNRFFRETTHLHTILREYSRKGQCPLVFIVSDSAGGDGNERLLFPKDVQAELNIANISFNPVAMMIMTKVLQRIASAQAAQGGYAAPARSTIDALVEASSGDIRAAINALQFSATKGSGSDVSSWFKSSSSRAVTTKGSTRGQKSTRGRKAPAGGKAGRKESKAKKEEAPIGTRDNSLFIFRALGKILYSKRGDPADFPDELPLPPHLSHHHRKPLLEVPEEVVEKSHVSGEFFLSYIHQNYLDFFSSIDDVVEASAYFSHADYLTNRWESRGALSVYAASVGTRGLMFNKQQAVPGGSWKPLHKPAWFATNKKARENAATAKSLFTVYCWTPEDLHTDVLPYLAINRTKLQNPAQRHFVQEAGHLSRASQTRNMDKDRLDENDVILEADDTDLAGNEVGQGTSEMGEGQAQEQVAMEEEDEAVIEDFDD